MTTFEPIASIAITECADDTPLVAVPRAEVQIIARFGPAAENGLDLHAFGAHLNVRRKRISAGQRAVAVRLHAGTSQAVFGMHPSALSGTIRELAELWGEADTQRLWHRLVAAQSMAEAARILEIAIRRRVEAADHRDAAFAQAAAARLASVKVCTVAAGLGMSERHLRRRFRDAFGLNPKAFTRLSRFHTALCVARNDEHPNWAGVAAAAGYCDQAHLIEEFRSIAGATPRAFFAELRAASPTHI